MNSKLFAFALLSAALISVGASPAYAQGVDEEAEATPSPIQFEQMGTYVLSGDLAVSKEFYATLFAIEPIFENPVFIGFLIEGGLFGIASREEFAPDATIGGNVVPYLRVTDIDEAFAHAKSVAPASLLSKDITREDPVALFMLRDPDGNMVEFYSLSSAAISSPAD